LDTIEIWQVWSALHAYLAVKLVHLELHAPPVNQDAFIQEIAQAVALINNIFRKFLTLLSVVVSSAYIPAIHAQTNTPA
jgi:hypothetical protein